MTDSSNVTRPRFGQGGRLYREEPAPAAPVTAAMGMAREAMEDQRVTDMLTTELVPPWADQPEPIPEASTPEPPPAEPPAERARRPKRPRRRKPEPEPEPPAVEVENPPHMERGTIGEPTEPEPPFDWREAISTGLELAGIALLVLTGFLITVWLGTLIAGIALVVLGVATSRNFNG